MGRVARSGRRDLYRRRPRHALPDGATPQRRVLRFEQLEDRALLSGLGTGVLTNEGGQTYYVNDSSTSLDEWCTAPGNDASDGLSPATPKATVQAVIAAYTLTAGDTVRIDTGSYMLTSNVLITSADSGDASGPVTFEASPYGVVMDRGGGYIAHFGWEITGPYVTVTTATSIKYPAAPQSFLKVTRGIVGFYITASNVTVSRSESSGNSANGFEIRNASVSNVIIRNALVRGNNTNGIYVYYASDVHVENCTIDANITGPANYTAVNLGLAQNFSLTNSIISVRGAGEANVEAWFANGATWTSDYNDFWANDRALIAQVPAAGGLGEWRNRTGQDAHSVSFDPLFVNPAAGDYHLQSTAGSYHGSAWTGDALTSCGVDAGYGDVGFEPTPNATPDRAPLEGLRNLGAYGGTEQASKTPGEPMLWLCAPATGQIIRGATQTIDWTWTGAGAQPGDTVKLEYSADSGATWIAIPGAESLPWETGTYAWDVSGKPTAARYRVRVTSNQPSPANSQSGSFQLRHGGAVTYYLNDAVTSDDVWATAPGSNDNDGLSPETPKCDVDDLLAIWDIEPGDMIVIDTGSYCPEHPFYMNPGDIGDATGRVIVSASPYDVTISLPWGSWTTGDYVTINTGDSQRYPDVPKSLLKIRGGSRAVNVYGESVTISGLDVSGASDAGIFINASQNALIENCVVWGNAETGIHSYYSATIRNCTIFDNTQYGIYVAGGATPTLENNIVWADGSGRDALYFVGSDLPSSNYNDLYATNGALVGHYGSDYATLGDWQAATGMDQASISTDPLLANRATGDAHLRSTGGRYDPSRGLPPEDPGAWIIDASKSPCIDAGNPATAYANEPRPNGGRVNIGAYGNTRQASRSYVNTAPVLDSSGTMILLPINQGAVDNSGTLVADILSTAGGDPITDADTGDLEGIAVTAVANTGGKWQYKVGATGTWIDFGPPSDSSARLLPADSSTWIRFVPDSDWSGTLDPGITFRAWDQTSGVAGGTADTSLSGGWSPFSTATETAAISVSAPPDLLGTAFSVTPDHMPRAETTVTYTIANAGDGAAGSFDVNIVLSDNDVIGDGDDILVATRTCPGLAGHASTSDSFSLIIADSIRQTLYAWAKGDDPPGLALPHVSTSYDYLGIVIDAADAVAETNESNNLNQGKGVDKDDVTYFPWDQDSSGQITATEALYVINCLGQTAPPGDLRADLDGNGVITPTDAVAVINRLGYERNTNVDEAPPAAPLAVATALEMIADSRPTFDGLSVYDPMNSTWYVRNTATWGDPDAVFGFGSPGAGWQPVFDDWNGDGMDTAGLYDPDASVWYLRNVNTAGNAEAVLAFGSPGLGWRNARGSSDPFAVDPMDLSAVAAQDDDRDELDLFAFDASTALSDSLFASGLWDQS